MLHNAAQGHQLPIIVRELLAGHNTKALDDSSDHLRYRQSPTATVRCLRACFAEVYKDDSGGSLCTLATAPPRLAVLEVPLSCVPSSERERQHSGTPDEQSDTSRVTEPVAGGDSLFEQNKQGETRDPVKVHHPAEK